MGKLERLIVDNCVLQDKKFSNAGINFAGRNWIVENPYKGTVQSPLCDYDCWPPHSKLDMKELINVTASLGEMKVEIHEGRRYLAGLLLYPAPLQKFQDILGDVLFLPARNEFKALTDLHNTDEWTPLSEENMDDFAKYGSFVVDAMAERVLMNMICTPVIKK